MKIRLLNWKHEPHYVEIPDNTKRIIGCILSGDMVLFYPIHFDTSVDRIIDYYDGVFMIPRSDFDKLDTIETSYDILEDYGLENI